MDTKELHKEAKQSSDEDIYLIAYKIWLAEGCPDGRHIEHWLKAESIWRSGHEITTPKQDEITSAGETAATGGKGKQKTKPASAATKPSRARPRTHPGPESR